MTITPELKRAMAEANGAPLRLEDPETDEAYLVTKEPKEELDPYLTRPIPEGLRLADEAFERDRPAMLADKKLKGKYVLYRRGERIAVGRSAYDLYRLAVKRGMPEGDFRAFAVEPRQTEHEITTPR